MPLGCAVGDKLVELSVTATCERRILQSRRCQRGDVVWRRLQVLHHNMSSGGQVMNGDGMFIGVRYTLFWTGQQICEVGVLSA